MNQADILSLFSIAFAEGVLWFWTTVLLLTAFWVLRPR